MLNRSISTDDKVAALGDDTGPIGLVFHHRLIAFLDMNGNVRADPYWLKGTVMPRVSGCSPEVCRKLAAKLEEHELAVSYEVGGMPYLHFPRFRENQVGLRWQRESPDVPVPEGFDATTGALPDDFRKPSGNVPESFRPEVEVEVEVEVEREDRVHTSNGETALRLDVGVEPEPEPPEWMHEVWHEVLGIDGHPIKLTDTRRQKYKAMYDEQLADAPDPRVAFRAVLYAVTKSEHHMSQRSYQMPESLLLNEDRRERWVQTTIDVLSNGARPRDRARSQRREELLAYLRERGEA